ncbi:MAG: hypothetical protein ACLQU5_11915, partial [Isosphaeraceae bacterium]
TLHPQSDEAAQSQWEKRKAELVEAIEQFDHELTGINSQLKTTQFLTASDRPNSRAATVSGFDAVPHPIPNRNTRANDRLMAYSRLASGVPV